MLRKFAIEGFRGFNRKLTFDLTKAHDYEFNTHLVHDGIISSGVIYGVNGSGKSSLGFAIFDIVGVLTDYELAAPMKDRTAYINAESDRKFVLFEYEFVFDGKILSYEYNKTAPDEIIEEKLIYDGILILNRVKEHVEFYINSALNIPSLSSNISALRFIYRNTQLPAMSPIVRLIKFVEKMLWFRSLNSRGYCGYTSGKSTLIDELYKMGKIREFEKFLNDIAGISLKFEVATSLASGAKELYIKYPKRKVEFFRASSTGTQELLLLFYWKSFALNDIKFLFIDEFDAFYHFELAAKIVTEIGKHTEMQSFFTSHNTYLANNKIMRPDCFFILSNGRITSFADATSRELREGHNLEKLLRSGEFGA